MVGFTPAGGIYKFFYVGNFSILIDFFRSFDVSIIKTIIKLDLN